MPPASAAWHLQRFDAVGDHEGDEFRYSDAAAAQFETEHRRIHVTFFDRRHAEMAQTMPRYLLDTPTRSS
jgi:hypothetical protein